MVNLVNGLPRLDEPRKDEQARRAKNKIVNHKALLFKDIIPILKMKYLWFLPYSLSTFGLKGSYESSDL